MGTPIKQLNGCFTLVNPIKAKIITTKKLIINLRIFFLRMLMSFSQNANIREGDQGPLTVIARHPKGKDAIIKCYESDEYQRLKAIRAPYTDWNFRLTEGKL